jgi:glyoxylase-like metal-dependent hydrolase (beta-lactamase superfamily II)
MTEKAITHITVGDIATNCWIYPLFENGGDGQNEELPAGFRRCAVIDPGGDADRIVSRLNQLKLVPAYILVTHGHFDHVAALPALASAYGRSSAGGGPLIAIHRADSEHLGPGSHDVHCRDFIAAGGSAAYVESLWEDMPPADRPLEEGDTIGPFTVLHLPGHSAGSAGFWDQEAGILLSGDTLFRGDYGRTDLPGGSEARLFESLKRLLAMDGDLAVLPGHGPATSIGDEARRFNFK